MDEKKYHGKVVKSLVEMSITIKEADMYIEEFEDCHTIKDKVDYLLTMFDARVVHFDAPEDMTEEQTLEIEYEALLTTIINRKWR